MAPMVPWLTFRASTQTASRVSPRIIGWPFGASPRCASGIAPARPPLSQILRPTSMGRLNCGHWRSSSGQDLEPPVMGRAWSWDLFKVHPGSRKGIVRWVPIARPSHSRECRPGIVAVEPLLSVSPGLSLSRGRAPAASVSPLLVSVLGAEDMCEGTRCQTDLVPAHLVPCSEFVVSRAC